MQSRSLRGVLLVAGVALALTIAAACNSDGDPTPALSPTTTETPGPIATAPTPPSPTATPDPGGPMAPTDVVITGRIPNLETLVTLGEAESGRISIT